MAVNAAIEDGVLEIVIDDPKRGNVVDLTWVADVGSALDLLGPEVGCVLVRSEGKNFCLGGDVTTFVGDDPAGDLERLVTGVHDVFGRLVELDVPFVVAVQGWAAGVGFSLALAADIVMVGASTRFKTAYTGIGLVSDGGMTWTLPRRVPQALALDLLLTDRVLGAEEAVALGVASRMTDDDHLVEEARALAGRLAAGPRDAQRAVKRLVRDGQSVGLVEQFAAEEVAMITAVVSPEGSEGVAAFLARRAPDYARARAEASTSTA